MHWPVFKIGYSLLSKEAITFSHLDASKHVRLHIVSKKAANHQKPAVIILNLPN